MTKLQICYGLRSLENNVYFSRFNDFNVDDTCIDIFGSYQCSTELYQSSPKSEIAFNYIFCRLHFILHHFWIK